MTPLVSLKKYTIAKGVLRVLQSEGWVSLTLAEIAELKKPSFTRVVVRFHSGQTKTLDLAQLSTKSFSTVIETLMQAVHDHRVRSSKHKST
jgi:hypothetical protein